jgi:hypothetical protein
MPGRSDLDVTILGGPTRATSARARSLARPYRLRRPVGRGDTTELLRTRKRPGVLVIVDGLFHETLAVGHAELRDALAMGWQVWGVASMGAIRAREMATLGMKGFGRVFQRFLEKDDFQDDEVALLHESTPPYEPLTEPLVHLRAATEHLIARGLVDEVKARRVLLELKARWFGERTLRGSIEALSKCGGRYRGAPDSIRDELRPFDRFRVKTIDLEDFLESRPWLLDDVSQIGPTAKRS